MGEIAVNKIKASSLVEVVVAMTILGIVTAVSLVIFTNISQSAPSIKLQQISCTLDYEIERIRNDEKIEDELIAYDGYTIEIEFVEHLINKQLQEGIFSAVIEGQERAVLEKKILIRKR